MYSMIPLFLSPSSPTCISTKYRIEEPRKYLFDGIYEDPEKMENSDWAEFVVKEVVLIVLERRTR